MPTRVLLQAQPAELMLAARASHVRAAVVSFNHNVTLRTFASVRNLPVDRLYVLLDLALLYFGELFLVIGAAACGGAMGGAEALGAEAVRARGAYHAVASGIHRQHTAVCTSGAPHKVGHSR